jgi:Xaa-Pro aminopeptidase
METRIAQMQEKLNQNNISAAVLRLPENIVLFSQYWPRNGFSFVFIPAEGEPCIIAPFGDQHDPYEGTIKDVRAFGWVRIADGNPYDSISNHLRELCGKNKIPGNAKVAVEMDFEQVAPPLCSGEVLLPSSSTYEVIKSAFKTDTLVPVNKMIEEIRVIKTQLDIEKLQLCNEIARKGVRYFNLFGESAETDVREIDIATRVESYIAQEALKNKHVKYCRVWAQISSGPNTANAWFAGMISSNRKIEAGDLVMLEMATVIDGYWSDLTETIVLGKPAGRQSEMLDSVKKAQELAIMGVHENAAASDIDSIARKYLDEQGLGQYFVHKTGHGVGFAYHESTPILGPGSPDILRSGMVHSVEPGVYISDIGGVRFEVNVLVGTDKGVLLG